MREVPGSIPGAALSLEMCWAPLTLLPNLLLACLIAVHLRYARRPAIRAEPISVIAIAADSQLPL